MMDAILFVEINTSGFGLNLLKKTIQSGHNIVFLTHSWSRMCSLVPELAKYTQQIYIIEMPLLENTNSIVERLREEPFNYTAIINTSDLETEVCAILAKEFDLNFLSPEIARLCKDKYLTRLRLKGTQFDTVDFKLMNSQEFNFDLFKGLVVVKPRNFTGSDGVAVFDKDNIEKAYKVYKSYQVKRFPRGLFKYDELLIEQFIHGDFYSIECFTANENEHLVLGVSTRIIDSAQNTIEEGLSFPYEGRFKDRLSNFATSLLKEIKYDYGFSHIEVIVNSTGIHLIEINPRIIGGNIPSYFPETINLDPYALFLILHSKKEVKLDILNALKPNIKGWLVKIRVLVSKNSSSRLNYEINAPYDRYLIEAIKSGADSGDEFSGNSSALGELFFLFQSASSESNRHFKLLSEHPNLAYVVSYE